MFTPNCLNYWTQNSNSNLSQNCLSYYLNSRQNSKKKNQTSLTTMNSMLNLNLTQSWNWTLTSYWMLKMRSCSNQTKNYCSN